MFADMKQSPAAKATMSVDEAQLLGVSRNTAFKAIARDDALAGVKAIRVGKRIVLPRRPIEDLAGVPANTQTA